MLYHYRKGAFCVNQSTKGIPKKGLPEGFLYVDEVIEDCIVDAKYAGTDNFMGRPAEGYTVPLVVVTKEAARSEERRVGKECRSRWCWMWRMTAANPSITQT